MCANIRPQKTRPESGFYTNKTHKYYSLEEEDLIIRMTRQAPKQVLMV